MNKRKILLSSIVIGLLALPSYADTTTDAPEEVEETSSLEVSGYLKTEIGAYTGDGASINSNETHDAGDLHKGEGTLKFFINSDVGEESSFHAELQAVTDTQGIDGYDLHRNYTQYDFLREAYIDTNLGDFDIRLGKQQVVWGKADGVKFLDIINPTDFREWAQNTMEDSRIPLWMGVIEKDLGNNDSLQFVWVPDVGRINQIPGLHNTATGDQNQPFVSYGAAALTGQTNGFLNIGNDFGSVASVFTDNFNYLLTGSTSTSTGTAPFRANILEDFAGMTISNWTQYTSGTGAGSAHEFLNNASNNPLGPYGGGYGTVAVGTTNVNTTQGASGSQILSGAVTQAGATSNQFDGTLNTSHGTQNDIFDYMGDTTFATFNDFQGMKTKYVVNPLSQKLKNHNFGIKYAKSTDFGLNYTLNYYRHWENNPVVNMNWADSNGATLTATPTENSFDGVTGAPVALGAAGSYTTTTMDLRYANGSLFTPSTTNSANLLMVQDVNRVNTLGASFDFAVDTSFAPIVIRGEFVYDKGSKAPQVDLGKLSYGDLTGAMTMADADMVKYVIGADVTIGKNLFTSLQFMDTWNLDYKDGNSGYTGISGQNTYANFTANPASLSILNGFRKAEEHQIMYTLFLSKPFLESDALRVNNLFLLENDEGGYWNRFDLEYSYSDDTILTAEWNKYGGDRFGVFGQFEEMSNVQVGAKYIF